jgi:hypothetical protein
VSYRKGPLGAVVSGRNGAATLPCILTAAHVMKQDDGGYFPYCRQPTSDSGRDIVGNYFRASQLYDCCLYVVDREGLFIIDPAPAHLKPGEPVALGGDSGALWVTVPVAGTPRPVGLLIKGKFNPDKGENYSVGLSAPLMARDLGIASFSP